MAQDRVRLCPLRCCGILGSGGEELTVYRSLFSLVLSLTHVLTLPHPTSSARLQVYALHGYPKFISSLISALPLSSPTQQRSSQALLDLFAYCLSNIAREVSFFDSLGPKYGLDLETRPKVSKEEGKLGGKKLRVWTRAYVDLLIATGAEAGSAGVAEGLTLLWAMEKVRRVLSLFLSFPY